MIKKLLAIILQIYIYNNSVDNHHHFFICQTPGGTDWIEQNRFKKK